MQELTVFNNPEWGGFIVKILEQNLEENNVVVQIPLGLYKSYMEQSEYSPSVKFTKPEDCEGCSNCKPTDFLVEPILNANQADSRNADQPGNQYVCQMLVSPPQPPVYAYNLYS